MEKVAERICQESPENYPKTKGRYGQIAISIRNRSGLDQWQTIERTFDASYHRELKKLN